ncbi:MAG: recombinase zinc beta ribbon domain-containing protein [Ethanoligenens sp.]
MLKNEKYAGIFVFNKTQRKIAGKRNGHLLKNKDEIIRVPGGVPAIVSQATWSNVQSKMQNNKRQAGSYSAKAIYILSGHIVCGKCNSAMTGKQARQGRNKQMYGYYECSARKRTRTCDMKPINKEYIEKEVINALYNNFFGPDVSDEVSTKLHESLSCHVKESEPYMKAAKKRLAQIQHEIDNVVNAVAAGMFHPSMKQKLDDLEAQKAALEIRISEAELESKSTIFSIEQIKGYLSIFSTIREMPAAEQKKVVDLFVEQVIVYEDHADFNFGFYIERMDRKKKTTQEGGLNGSYLNLDGGGEGS